MHFPFIHVLLRFSTHASKQHPSWEAWHRLDSVALTRSAYSPPLKGLFSASSHFIMLSFCFYCFFGGIHAKFLHISFILCSRTFLVWLRARQIMGNLMKGRALVGILFIVTPFTRGRLVSASAPGLSGRPVDDDKWQTHDHEHESQCGKAGGLREGREREQHLH